MVIKEKQTTVLPETVLAKLLELQDVHDKAGFNKRAFGVDTLSMIFHTSHEQMMHILTGLAEIEEVTLSSNSHLSVKTGRPPIWFVSLRT